MISLRTWLGLYLQIYADPNPSTSLPPVCTLPPRPPPALTCVTATASNLFSRRCSPAHTILFKPSSHGYSAKSQIMSWLCSKPSNLWSPTASHFQSLQWPMTSPIWLGSHTLLPFTPRHWPHSSHNGLRVVHHPHQPGSHPLARTHPGNPVAQPSDLHLKLTSSVRASLITPHPACPILRGCFCSMSFVITSNIIYSLAYLLMVYLR